MSKRKLRFNLIDILILLVILAACAVVAYIFVFSDARNQSTLTQDSTVEVQYIIEVTDVDANTEWTITEGDPVLDTVEKRSIGTVSSYEVKEQKQINYSIETGEEQYSVVENRNSIYITITAQATESDMAYSIDGYDIRVGKLVSMVLPKIQCYGYCIGLSVIG